MKKYIKYIVIIFLIVAAFFVPKYYELNDLTIIDGIGIEYKNKQYTLYLREVIPTKENNNLKYKHKIYEASSNKIDNLLSKISKKTKKKLYLKKVKFLITNINSSKIIKELGIEPKVIFHTKNIKKELKDY